MQLLIESGLYYCHQPPFPVANHNKRIIKGEIGIANDNKYFSPYLWPLNPSILRSENRGAGTKITNISKSYWKFCNENHFNQKINVCNKVYYRVVTVHARSSILNKLNHILENVSEISLTCQQLRLLLSKLPSGVMNFRSTCCISLFSKLVDPDNFEIIVLSLLTSRERDSIINKLGVLNIWTPTYCDRNYILHLKWPDQRKLCQHLINLSVEEDGDRHLFNQLFFVDPDDEEHASEDTATNDGDGTRNEEREEEDQEETQYSYQNDSRFIQSGSSYIPPSYGIFSFRYGVLKRGPSLDVRMNYMKHCYSGRCKDRAQHYLLEIASATKIQSYIRRTVCRLRYTRGMWLINVVDFSTPKSRDAAVTIQGLYRGYLLRKIMKQISKKRGELTRIHLESKLGKFKNKNAPKSESMVTTKALQTLSKPASSNKPYLMTSKEKRRRRSCFMMNTQKLNLSILNNPQGGLMELTSLKDSSFINARKIM